MRNSIFIYTLSVLAFANLPGVLAQFGAHKGRPPPKGPTTAATTTTTTEAAGPTTTNNPSPTTTTEAAGPTTTDNPSPTTNTAPSQASTTANPPATSSSSGSCADGEIRFNFSGGSFHWLNSGGWGSASGDQSTASQCLPIAANAAMFICDGECDGSGDASPAKYTKLECTLGGSYQNCDMSLVDGFSLPVACTIPGGSTNPTIGGTVDLYNLATCPSPAGDGSCANSNSYDASESDVSTFFQNADGGSGGNYCVYQTCSAESDTFFTGTPDISCVVGSGSSSKKKRGAEGLLSLAHLHGHGRAHARSIGVGS